MSKQKVRRCIYCGKPFFFDDSGEPTNLDGTPHKPICDRTGFGKAMTDMNYRRADNHRKKRPR